MIWKDVEGFNGYQVSDTGLVKSNKYWGQFKRRNKGGLLEQRTYYNGYKYVNLYKKGHMYSLKVHRLVAQAFIPNPNNYPQINHKDENRANNNASNLEWCDAKYNLNYNNLQIRQHNLQKRKIGAFNEDMKLIHYFPSLTDAGNYVTSIGLSKNIKSAISNIGYAANKEKIRKNYGYLWRYLEPSHRKKSQVTL